MRNRNIILGILAVLLAGWLIWSYVVPHTTLSEGPMTYTEAQPHSPIPLPPSAENIRVATYRHMATSVAFIKLQAPLTDCRNLALRLLPGATPEKIKFAATQPSDYPPPASSPRFTTGQLDWFDSNRVSDGERYISSDRRVVIVISIMSNDDRSLPPSMGTLYYRQDE